MKSNYKRLGDYVREVNVRNSDLAVKKLVGLTIDKAFIPSVANIIGTDMSNYKIIRKEQFACSLMQVSRDEKMPIAMFFEEEAIISPAYPMFEVIDKNLLLPQYLMMWFARKEFDREVSFYAVGGVRGSLTLEDFYDLQLPIPSLEKQKEIVSEYEVLSRRISLNEQICNKLEATAQALYKKMFVDDVDLENLKDGWRVGRLSDVAECFDSQRKPLSGLERNNMEKLYPYYGAASLMDYVDNYIFEGAYILMGEDGTVINNDNTPILQYVKGKFWVNNHAHVLKGINGFDENLLFLVLKNTQVGDVITGGVQQKINQANLFLLQVLIPNICDITNIINKIKPIFNSLYLSQVETNKIIELKELLLSRLATN